METRGDNERTPTGRVTMHNHMRTTVSRFTLSTLVEEDIADIDTIFGMLDARGLYGLTQGNINDLVGFSENKGHSASMARSLLMLHDYRFETQYVLPDPDPEPFIWLPEAQALASGRLIVTP